MRLESSIRYLDKSLMGKTVVEISETDIIAYKVFPRVNSSEGFTAWLLANGISDYPPGAYLSTPEEVQTETYQTVSISLDIETLDLRGIALIAEEMYGETFFDGSGTQDVPNQEILEFIVSVEAEPRYLIF